jgi:hypothetical protein
MGLLFLTQSRSEEPGAGTRTLLCTAPAPAKSFGALWLRLHNTDVQACKNAYL